MENIDSYREIKMNLRITASTLVIATLLATPALAQDAQPDSGWYSTLLGGVAFGGASDVAQNGTIVPNDTDLGKKTGWAISGAGGYDWGLFRTELEAAHRHNAADGDGSFKTNSFMANLLADVPISNNGLTIYAGGGVGIAKTVFDAITSPNVPFAVTGDDWGGAYQAIAGLRMPFTDTISGHLDYRFFDPHDVDLVDSVGGRAQTGHYSSHTVMVGLSVLFGKKAEAAPPPPPPPAASAACRGTGA
jgi:opacity protein-like surface antigen